jgi:hypothetical protein
LDGSHLTVTSESEEDPNEDETSHQETTTREAEEVEQSDKPRAGSVFPSSDVRLGLWFLIVFLPFIVAAEYIAKGYVLSDQVLHRAIELDSELPS